MPFKKIKEPSEILVNGRIPEKLAEVGKPYNTDRHWRRKLNEAIDDAVKRMNPPADAPED